MQALIKNVVLTLSHGDDEQAFGVNFRDRAHLMAFVNPNDPTEITRVIRCYGNEFIVKDADGTRLSSWVSLSSVKIDRVRRHR